MISQRVQKIHPAATIAITVKAAELTRQGIDVAAFGAGEPDFDTPEHIKDAAMQAIREGFTKYTASSGIPELKQAVIEKFKRDNDLIYTPKQVLVSTGAKQCLSNILFALINPGDEVLIPIPYWVSYPEMVTIADGKPVFVPAKKDFKIDATRLEEYLTPKTKALIVNYPSNPTGATYSREELLSIGQWCVKNNIVIISDEIYEKLLYDGKQHASIASLGDAIKRKTIVVNGVSKAFSMTGWRIGYCAGPEDIIQAASVLQDHLTANPNSIAQKAAVAALTGSEESTDMMKKAFLKRRNYMVKQLQSMPGVVVHVPDGAFYLFIDVSGTYTKYVPDSITFCEKLLSDYHVAAVPGAPFGDDRCIRLSFVTSMETIQKGLERLESCIRAIKQSP